MRPMVWISVVVVLSCASQTHPVLELTLSRKTVVDSLPVRAVRVRVVGTNAEGKIGTGTVKITSEAGSLTDPVEVQLDNYGTATVDLICDPLAEAACADRVKVSATWTSDKELASAEALLDSAGVGGAGGAGGTGGTGGGTGGAGGMFSTSKVLLLGTLQEGSCGRDALADPRHPTEVAVAFPCYVDERSAKRVGSTLYYVDISSSGAGVRKFRADTFDRVNGMAAYPSPDKSPDEVLFADCGNIGFWVSPAARLLHFCPARSRDFLFIDGVQTTIPSSTRVMAFGEGDAILTENGVLAGGVLTPVSIIGSSTSNLSLAVSGGFIMTVAAGTAACDLMQVTLSGTVTKLGSYPVECPPAWRGALEADGTLTLIGADGIFETVVEVPLNGVPSMIYSEANETPSDWTRYPPRVYVKIHISDLVGGN